MAEVGGEPEYISLHGCIRNTTSDAEDLTEHQLRAGRVSDHQKRIYRSIQHSVAEGRKGKRGEWAGQELLLIPTLGAIIWTEGSIWGYWSVQQLICENGQWEPHRQSLPQPYVLYRDTSPLQHAVPGSWSEGIEKTIPKVRSAVDYGRWHTEMWGGDYWWECLWRKAWQPWRQGDTTESCVGVKPSM